MGKRASAAIAAASIILTSTTAQAADCWQPQAVSAGKVRDLQTMLMVAALRCRTVNGEILAAYNRFMTAQMSAITATNGKLKRHFNGSYGPVEGQREYDRFTTTLANTYGSDGAGAESCADFTALAHAAAEAGSEAGLLQIAEDRGLVTPTPTRSCRMEVASAEPQSSAQ